jgi:hypothetical protein
MPQIDEDELFTNVLSKKELEAMIDQGKDDDEGLFETVGKAADAVGKTRVGQKIGAILAVIMLAILSGGANLTILQEYFNGEDTGPIGGCKDPEATNYNSAATFEDGSCTFLVVIYGCTNSEAENYNSQATHDDGRCVVINDIPNGTNGNETAAIYGCMDTTANNYDDKATEDDGSCDYEDEYEEEHGNHTSAHFYPGWEGAAIDNVSVFWVDPDAEGISVLVDVDTDCYDYNTSVLLYVDVWNHVPEDTEGEQQYAWKDINLTVEGMAWDEHWLNFTFEELNETEGTWSMWVALLVWDVESEDYIFQQQFNIPMIRVQGGTAT